MSSNSNVTFGGDNLAFTGDSSNDYELDSFPPNKLKSSPQATPGQLIGQNGPAKIVDYLSPPAVHIESGYKNYGSLPVLTDFNMTIKEHTIYGLLGSSGCGKTTVLSCIVGLRRLDAGEIQIYGEKPGSKESGVPGSRVGYMPQEVALHSQFTIREVMQYFGRIYGMTMSQVDERREYLVKLLHLDTCKGRLGELSGGQKRRISFAVALLHEPELLILDEPTVGVDPLLRQSIWQHLIELATKRGTTVIITTHYIEETRQADTIGMMRNGRMVVEDSPTALLQTFNCNLLEDIVIKVCLRDEAAGHEELQRRDGALKRRSSSLRSAIQTISAVAKTMDRSNVVGLKFQPSSSSNRIMESSTNIANPDTMRNRDFSTTFANRITALTIKNGLVLSRNIIYLLFLFMLPAVQIIVVHLCFGTDPKSLNFGVVNYEVPRAQDCWYEDDLCIIANLSCRYTGSMDSNMITLVSYDTESEALQEVTDGKIWGYLTFPENFTDNMFDRIISGGNQSNSNETIAGSSIRFKMDMSSTPLGLSLKKEFYDSYQKFMNTFLNACGENVEGKVIPLVFEEPVYGNDGFGITDFITPAMSLLIVCSTVAIVAGLDYITEKKDGMLQRATVAGVLHMEIIMSHAVTNFFILVVKSAILFVVMFLVFDTPRLGSLPLAFVLILLNGVAGMSLGFVTATACNEEKNAMLISIGTLMPSILLSGVLFPFESLPVPLQYLGYLVPCTFPVTALRSILFRGWGLTHFTVWIGFVAVGSWIAIYWTIIFIVLKLTK